MKMLHLLKCTVMVVACSLFTQYSLGRDVGYALECTAIENGRTQIISFLEDEVDKRVRYLETESPPCGIVMSGSGTNCSSEALCK